MYIHKGCGSIATWILLKEKVCVCVRSAEGSVVFSAVCDQVGALTEGFTTHFTHMGLLSWTKHKVSHSLKCGAIKTCTQYTVNRNICID